MTQPQQPRKELTPGHSDRTEGQDPEALAWTKQLSQADPAAAGALTVDMTSSGRRHGALLSKPRPEAPGYVIGQLLGTGTYGEVWEALEEGTGIRVAIKFFAHGTGQQWQMLQAEVKQLAQLDGVRGIVQLKDVCPEARPPYYVMAYAEKGSLKERLDEGPLPLAEALVLFRQITEALAYVHAKGVRHCDLKPGNILLDARGHAMLADFGQAHLSDDASPALGTFFYMAPEQADLGRPIPDTRWDVYGLGAVLYAMLCGEPPRAAEEVRRTLEGTEELAHRLRRYREWIPKAPRPQGHRRARGMDGALAEIIDACLEIDPQRRLHDAGAVLAALRLRLRRQRQRPLLLFGLIAPLVLLLFMALAGLWWGHEAIDRSQRELTEQLLESDEVGARLVANVVQEHLEDRIALLDSYADLPALAEATEAGRRPALEEFLLELMASSGRTRSRFSEATVSDRKGKILALVKGKNGTLAVSDPDQVRYPNYSWRDWFSGQGDRTYQEGVYYPPIAAMHLSDPYVSTSEQNLFISISFPLRDPAAPDGPPVGVLEAAIKLDEISHWLLDVQMKNGHAVLLDRRRYCVLHPDRKILPHPGELPPRFDFSQLEAQMRADRAAAGVSRDGSWLKARLGGVFGFAGTGPLAVLPWLYLPEDSVSGKLTDYRDPVDDTTYLAGYAQFSNDKVGWVALVQHDRAAALRPTDELRGQMNGIAWKLLAAAGMVAGGLWAWLFWMLRHKEDLSHG